MKNKRIYLDYAATTPIDPKVLKAMKPYFQKEYGNPSSIHNFGQKGQMAIDEAREKVANFLNCFASEIIFTGSATEANNLVIFGVVRSFQKIGMTPHIITTQIEHPAILEPFKKLQKEGIETTYIKVDKEGIVKISEIQKALKENTVLVSVMCANNEIGTIQPIKEIAEVILRYKKQNPNSKILFHTDAVQAINYLDCDVKNLGVDLLTLSAHKIYGPKGVGALFIKEGTKIESLIYGGGQENDMRSGTENVPGIVGLGAAIEEVKNEKPKITKMIKLRDKVINRVLKKFPAAELNGSFRNRLPNNINVTIPGAEGEALVIALDEEGIAASTGSACSQRGLEPSHVLLALGLTEEQAHCSLRITLGRYTEQKEISKFLRILPKIIKKLRKISGFTK